MKPAKPTAAARAAASATLQGAALATVLTLASLDIGPAQAGQLYRWSEPDGALTFSPTPPTDGTPYEEVDPMTMKPRGESAAAVDAPREPAPKLAATRTEGTTEPAPTLGAAAVHRALPRTIIRSAEPADGPTSAAAPVTAPAARGIIASTDKEERCEELQKRVISLERRLATPLTPEDMDNTVVQMARYQRSFERNCRR